MATCTYVNPYPQGRSGLLLSLILPLLTLKRNLSIHVLQVLVIELLVNGRRLITSLAKATAHVLMHFLLHLAARGRVHSVAHVRPHASTVTGTLVHNVPHVLPHRLLERRLPAAPPVMTMQWYGMRVELPCSTAALFPGTRVKPSPRRRVLPHRSVSLSNERGSERNELSLRRSCGVAHLNAHRHSLK